MNKITKNELQNYAKSIQIAINEDEMATMQAQINDILDYVSLIDNFDDSNEELNENFNKKMILDANSNKFREDFAANSISIDESLKNAHKKNENFFKVPKFIDN